MQVRYVLYYKSSSAVGARHATISVVRECRTLDTANTDPSVALVPSRKGVRVIVCLRNS